jgi:hypothetical protein
MTDYAPDVAWGFVAMQNPPSPRGQSALSVLPRVSSGNVFEHSV